jgi:hypothetical protein
MSTLLGIVSKILGPPAHTDNPNKLALNKPPIIPTTSDQRNKCSLEVENLLEIFLQAA